MDAATANHLPLPFNTGSSLMNQSADEITANIDKSSEELEEICKEPINSRRSTRPIRPRIYIIRHTKQRLPVPK